jgi:hypothetical protein
MVGRATFEKLRRRSTGGPTLKGFEVIDMWWFDGLLPTFDSGTFTLDGGDGVAPIAVLLLIAYELRLATVNPEERTITVFE